MPWDLSVVGIDDIQFSTYTNPSLTTIAQPKQELGKRSLSTHYWAAHHRPVDAVNLEVAWSCESPRHHH